MHSHFVLNGIRSDHMDLRIIYKVGEFRNSPFLPDRTVNNEVSNVNYMPYGEDTIFNMRQFELEFASLNKRGEWVKMTPDRVREVSEWLYQPDFVEFYTVDNPSRLYYVKAIKDDGLLEGGDDSGRFTITFHSYPTAWTPIIYSEYSIGSLNEDELGIHSVDIPTDGENLYEPFRDQVKRLRESKVMSSVTDTIRVENLSTIDNSYTPRVYITGLSDTDLEIVNLSNGGKRTYIQSIKEGEVIHLDNIRTHLESSIDMRKPNKHFNYEWIELVKGVNRLKVTGHVKLQFICQFPIT